MGKLLEGKVAVVTGSGRGIGRGEAIALAAAGAKVVVNDAGVATDGTGAAKTPADEVVSEIKNAGGIAVASYGNVATMEGAQEIIKAAIDAFGAIHILVNNAGILRDRMIHNMTPEEWDAVMKVHLYGHFYCTRAAVPLMREQKWGRIINTSSTSGLGSLGQANYSAAKEGIVGLTRTVALDVGRYGITCNALRPGAATRMTLSDEVKAKLVRTGQTEMLKYLETMHPDDVAPLVVYLASDKAANINGCVFKVWGGEIGIYPHPEAAKTIIKEGRWTIDELLRVMPNTVAQGLVNPAPPQPSK